MKMTNARPIATLDEFTVSKDTLIIVSDGVSIDAEALITTSGVLIHALDNKPTMWKAKLPGAIVSLVPYTPAPKTKEKKMVALDDINDELYNLGLELDVLGKKPRLRIQHAAWKARHQWTNGVPSDTIAMQAYISRTELQELLRLGLLGEQTISKLRR